VQEADEDELRRDRGTSLIGRWIMSQDAQMFWKALALYHGLQVSYQVIFTAECFFSKNRDKKMTTTVRVSKSLYYLH
jgi:hypothetical protein